MEKINKLAKAILKTKLKLEKKEKEKYDREVDYWTNHICPKCGAEGKDIKFINPYGDCICEKCKYTGHNEKVNQHLYYLLF